MRWKQKLDALPKPPDIRKLTLPKLLALFALLAGGLMVTARMLGAGGSEQVVIRLGIVGLLVALAFVAFKGAKDLIKKATRLQWVALAVFAGLDFLSSNGGSGRGIDWLRFGTTGAFMALSWVLWVMPKAGLLQRVMVIPWLPTAVWSGMVFSAEPPASTRKFLATVNVAFRQQAPSATADIVGGLGASLGELWNWLIGPIVGLFS